jgi:Cupin domain
VSREGTASEPAGTGSGRGRFGCGELRARRRRRRSSASKRINPTDPEQSWSAVEGEDYCYVIGGQMRIEFERSRRIGLGPGDALNHEGGAPHRWAPAGDDPAEVLVVNSFRH